jgi:hypothetical protein
MTVSSRALGVLSDALRAQRSQRRTRRRKLPAGPQALLVVAYLRKGETYADLACGFSIGTSTVYRYIREALDLLAALAPTLEQAIEVAARKAFVILDGAPAAYRPGRDGNGVRPGVLQRHAQGARPERPRPPLPAEVVGYEQAARRRLLVRPGMTGLWQISGRSELSWEESVRLDLRYIENWSPMMDLSILWKTVGAVIRGDGAY